ncbi:YceI family protein [Pseudoflavitalea sp. G-6-1-2]|uniref:YceI family protein n=1 Tax=Pseudoflavitalea sp. G-6-1-2 TaxID=2728841 RepID=UPI00146B7D03|nr:YceI family protein [Pseudoflavitalea sp. G-6-1-2]NML20873.1 YceI family protein [Pseudoflavitalea sp. G-6-1-2]
MKKLTILPFLTFALLSWKSTPADNWAFDEYHAKLRFSITHLMMAEVEGSFKIKESSITSNGKDFSDAVVTLVADAASVNTENEMRDKNLRAADCLDTDKFPTISFKSTSFVKKSDNEYTVTGPLTLHGVTKVVSLNAVARNGENPMNHAKMCGFKVTGKINRKDFGVSSSTPAALLGDEIDVVANVEYVKK